DAPRGSAQDLLIHGAAPSPPVGACARSLPWRVRGGTSGSRASRRVVDLSRQSAVVNKSALEKAREAPGSTKARILSAAEEVFAARGFTGASTREIAARAGVHISSLHYHWASKETLYFAVFRNMFDQIVELLREAL